MFSIEKFGGRSTAVELVGKDGKVAGARIMRQKEYGELHGYKGQELKRKYRAFFLSQGGAAMKDAAAEFFGGDYLLKQVRRTKSGDVTLTATPKRNVTGGMAEDVKKAAVEMDDASFFEALAIMEAQKAERAARAATLEITDEDVAAAVLV